VVEPSPTPKAEEPWTPDTVVLNYENVNKLVLKDSCVNCHDPVKNPPPEGRKRTDLRTYALVKELRT
jgi:hypothetical protein